VGTEENKEGGDNKEGKKKYKRYERGDEEKDVSLKSCMLSFFFVFENVIVNKNQQSFKNWKEVLMNIFAESPSACGWVLHLLSTTRRERLLKYCLIEASERWLREGFAEFLSLCLKVKKKRKINSFSKKNFYLLLYDFCFLFFIFCYIIFWFVILPFIF
jgi:hypothetical protein